MTQDETVAVTVVTVVFNAVKGGRGEQLRQCLSSVQTQEGVSIEHVIVDGGSQDGTLEILEGMPAGPVPRRIISRPDNGIYHAMNRGIDAARGRAICFLNSDDYFHHPRAMALLSEALEREDADLAYARARVVDREEKVVAHAFADASPYQVIMGMPLCHQAMLTSRRALVDLGGFDRRYKSAADYDLFLKLVLSGRKSVRVDQEIVTFRQGGFSEELGDLSKQETGAIYADVFNRYLGTNLTVEEGQQYAFSRRIPEHVLLRYHRAARTSFGEAYHPTNRDIGEYANLFLGMLDRDLSDFVFRRLFFVKPIRSILGRLMRVVKPLDSRVRAFCAERMYKTMVRIPPMESANVLSRTELSYSGVLADEPLVLEADVKREWRNRAVNVSLRLKLDIGDEDNPPNLLVSANGVPLRRYSPRTNRFELLTFTVPKLFQSGETVRIEIRFADDSRSRKAYAAGSAALIFGGGAVWRR